jgi:hypothetical protein
MLSRMEEWTQAKWERIDAELKVPCTGKCSYNGCSTCSLQPLSKHVRGPATRPFAVIILGDEYVMSTR